MLYFMGFSLCILPHLVLKRERRHSDESNLYPIKKRGENENWYVVFLFIIPAAAFFLLHIIISFLLEKKLNSSLSYFVEKI